MIKEIEIRGGDEVYLKDAIPYHFSGQRVVVKETKVLINKDTSKEFFITVNDVEIPTIFVHRSFPLIRNGHKISLTNKKIVVRVYD